MEINVDNIILENGEEEFLANMCQGGRITVPQPYRESLNLKQGTRVRIKIRKDDA